MLLMRQEEYTPAPLRPKGKEADPSIHTWATEWKGRATDPKKIQRFKNLEAILLGREEAKGNSEVKLLRSE